MPGGDTDREKQGGMEGVGLIIHMMKQLSGMKRTARALECVFCVSCNGKGLCRCAAVCCGGFLKGLFFLFFCLFLLKFLFTLCPELPWCNSL